MIDPYGPEERVVTHMTQSELIDPKVEELLDRIKASAEAIRSMINAPGQTWTIGYCNQIEKDLEEIKAMLRLSPRKPSADDGIAQLVPEVSERQD